MIVARLLTLVLTILAVPTTAAAQVFTTYDAFTGPLSSALWAGLESNTNFVVISNTETQRAVVKPDPFAPNRFLQLGLTTAHPGSGGDTGEAGQGRQRVRVVRDDIVAGAVTVTGFRTRVTMLSTAVTACPTTTNASPTRAMAHMSFFFFNDGSSTGATDATGDVFAGFNVEQSSVSGRIIGAFLGRCTDATCSTIVTDKFQTFIRRWAVGVAVPLTVVWDHTNDQFIFTVGTGSSAEQHVLTYGDIPLTDAAAPVLDIRDLQARNVLPHCTTPVRASATARYDFLQIATETGVFP